jgi:hypothetical protein
MHYSALGEVCDTCHGESLASFQLVKGYVGSTLLAVFLALVAFLSDPCYGFSAVSVFAAVRTLKIAPIPGPKVAAAISIVLVAAHLAWEFMR